MAKRTIENQVYGEMTYKEDYWVLKDKMCIEIAKKKYEIVVELDVNYPLYEEFKLKLLPEGLMKHYSENTELLEVAEAEKVFKMQERLFLMYSEVKKNEVCNNLEEAALKKREEILEGQTVESFSKIVGKEKAKRCFAAKTREEKLASLELKKMRIFKDCIEIKCTCDWFKPSGGFSIFEDGSVEMVYVDSLSF